MGEFVRVETKDGIGTIRLDRPPMNALNAQVQEELRAAAAEVTAASEVRAVIVYGGEKVFAAGADIKEMARLSYPEMAARVAALTGSFDAVARIPKPVVAAITGYALGGGCELALTCDWRIAATDAKLGQPEINLGIIPGGGGTQRLPRLVGTGTALKLLFSGTPIDAAEALRIGLVDEVVPAAALREHTLALAAGIAEKSPVALRLIKEAVRASLRGSLDDGLRQETALFGLAFSSEDKAEGVKALLEKRKAEFRGR